MDFPSQDRSKAQARKPGEAPVPTPRGRGVSGDRGRGISSERPAGAGRAFHRGSITQSVTSPGSDLSSNLSSLQVGDGSTITASSATAEPSIEAFKRAESSVKEFIKKSLADSKSLRFHQCYFNPISCFRR